MSKGAKNGVFAAAGLVYALVAMLLATVLIRNFGGIFGQLGAALGLESALTEQLTAVFDQLKQADVQMPWLVGILLGAAGGVGLEWILPGKVSKIVTAVLLFLPMTLAFVWFAQVNGVQVGGFFQLALSLIQGLM